VYRRVLMHDIVVDRRVQGTGGCSAANAVCVANHFRCKIPHVKAVFRVLTDERNDAAVFRLASET